MFAASAFPMAGMAVILHLMVGKRLITARLLDGLGLAFAVAAVLAVLHYWDPTRAMEKRLAPGAAQRYDRVPAGLPAPPADHWITVRDAATAAARRRILVERIFGAPDLPTDVMPQHLRKDVDKDPGPVNDCLSPQGPAIVHLLSRMDTIIMRALGCEATFYAGWDNLAGIDELSGYLVKAWRPYSIAYFRPKQANGRLILYQQGLAATYHDVYRLIETWVADGYTVAAMNMPGYGDNTCYDMARYCSGPLMPARFGTKLAQRFLPPVVAVNYALSQRPFSRIAMVGISSGAWITAVSAAIDPRITDSVPVSGVLPEALLVGKEESALEIVKGIDTFVSMPDLAVMAADRPGRRQVQIFNRYDRCCFYGPRPTLYGAALTKAAGGRVVIVFDESHARHKISAWAMRRIAALIGAGGDGKVRASP